MIDTKSIHPTTPPERKPKGHPATSCNDFIKMIAEKQKQQKESEKINIAQITIPTSWEVNVGNRLSELGQAIAACGKIKNEWHRELYSICDFITYMEMGDMEENHYD